jgi:hypothetical protein
MATLTHITTPRTFRRVSAEAIAHFAATDAQAARFAGLGHFPSNRSAAPARFWDSALLDRLSAPLSRVRE